MMYKTLMISCTMCCSWLYSQPLDALPPLGFTHLGQVPGGALEVIDGTAYIAGQSQIWVVKGTGDVDAIELSHPTLGSLSRITRVVKGPDGDLYAGASFVSQDSDFRDAALFRLDQPNAPIVTWPFLLHLVGIDRDLRGIANVHPSSPAEGIFDYPVELFLDGSMVPLKRPTEPQIEQPLFARALSVSESGLVVGEAALPQSLRLEGAIWTPDGEFSYIPGILQDYHGTAGSIRDRSDGQGVNVGLANVGRVKYGEESIINLHEPMSDFPILGHTIVSQGDFAILNEDDGFFNFVRTLAYYPGIVPADPGAVLPIEEVFPQLTTIGFEAGGDLYAVDGRIYMTLVGEDGLYLFGARDPSVIPEPSTVVLAVLLAGGVFVSRRGMFPRNCDSSAVC